MLEITACESLFGARSEEDVARETVAAFRRMLLLQPEIDPRGAASGQGGWTPSGDPHVGIGAENATRYPSPGELIFYPGGASETSSCSRTAMSRSRARPGALAGTIRDDRLGQREPA